MIYSHIFDDIAIEEYEQATSWYGQQSMSAMDNFIKSVDDKIRDICLTPYLYRNRYKKYRETSLNKFPYSIVYFVDENAKTISITSIYHHKRNPKKKYKK